MDKNRDTAGVILDTAQSMVQDCGFNGFSYAHIAKKVGIRTASIHYHFPNKGDLGEAMILRYLENFLALTAEIDATTQSSSEKLHKFILIYRGAPVQGYRTCLSVMLATDLTALSDKAREELAKFFTANLVWLERVLNQGQHQGDLHFEGSAHAKALQFLASLQGAQLLARSFRDLTTFDMIANGLVSALTE